MCGAIVFCLKTKFVLRMEKSCVTLDSRMQALARAIQISKRIHEFQIREIVPIKVPKVSQ